MFARNLTFFSLLPLLVALLANLSVVVEGRRTDFRLSPAKRAPSSSSTYSSLQNGERLRRGLPLAPPPRLFTPSRVQARDPGASPVPIVNRVGKIKVVRASDNLPIGYMSAEYQAEFPSPYNWYGPSSSNLHVSFDAPASGPVAGPVNINILTPGEYDYLGLVGSAMPSPTDPDPYQQNVGRITRSNPTTLNAGPSDVLNGRWPYQLHSETAVWKFDPSTHELTAIWVSENLAVYPVTFFNWFGGGAHINGFAFVTNTLTYMDLLDLYLVPSNNQEQIRFFFEAD